MGGSASRELEAAQGQVKRLTAEVSRLSGSLVSKEASLSKLQQEVGTAKQYKEQLQVTKVKLDAASAELLKTRRQVHELPFLKQELQETKIAKEGKQSQLSDLETELAKAKAELEDAIGELKFSQQEKRSLERLRAASSGEEQQRRADEDEADVLSMQLVAQANQALGTDDHPIFGRLLREYGHKRLYSANPLTLWSGTVVWDKQRAFRPARAELIAQAKAKSAVSGWPGTISVVETQEVTQAVASADARRLPAAVVDGQHRLGAAHVLSRKGRLSPMLEHILVEVYPPMEDKHVKELFTEINKAEPVSLVDLPDVGATNVENAMLSEAAEVLSQRYPDMFKASLNCRPPHLNVDLLRNEMHKARLLERHQFTTTEGLVRWLEATNKSLASCSAKEWLEEPGARFKSESALNNALTKARDKKFFLGLSLSWLVRNEVPN